MKKEIKVGDGIIPVSIDITEFIKEVHLKFTLGFKSELKTMNTYYQKSLAAELKEIHNLDFQEELITILLEQIKAELENDNQQTTISD